MNENNLIKLINNLRTNPSNYTNYLEILQKENLSQKNIFYENFLTKENIKNILEIVKNQKPQKPFKTKEALNKITKDYLLQIIKNQDDIDSIDLEEITESYGNFNGFLIKYIDFESLNKNEFINKFLFCNEFDDKKKKLKTIFNKNVNYIGISSIKICEDSFITVVLFCSVFKEFK